MSGKLVKNLRKGHSSEDLGNIFLRKFCAVAELRQEDDFGIDSIATLLKQESKYLIPEESFGVQIKSVSINKVEYNDDEINWLLELDLPFFVCTVDKKTQSFSLFTLNRFHSTMTLGTQININKVVLILGENPNYGNINIDIRFDENDEKNDEPFEIHLGNPILSANLGECESPEFIEKIYSIMKEWLLLEYEMIRLRKINTSYTISWKTWKKPELGIPFSVVRDTNIKKDLLASKDYLHRLSKFLYVNRDEDAKLIEAFDLISDWYELNEVPIQLIYSHDPIID